jgi:hypothetical protein
VSLALALGASAFAAATLGVAPSGHPQDDPLSGVWTAEKSRWKVAGDESAAVVQLSLRRSGMRRGDWNSSFMLPLTDLRGLTVAQMGGGRSEVRFELPRDAGTMTFEGRFQDASGAGHFTFVPNQEFVAAMRARGFANLDAERVFSLAVHDVSRQFIRDLADLGYPKLDLDQLVNLRIHGATPAFVRELAALGYRGLPAEGLVNLRIHGASPDFIRDFKALGYERLTTDELVNMRIHGVSAAFVRELKDLGYEVVPVDELVNMRIHGVTTDFVKRAKASAGRLVAVDRLVDMRIHNREP